MRKLLPSAIDRPPRTRGAPLAKVLLVVIVLLLSPLLYDVTGLCVARWKTMFGVYTPAETPVLDALGAAWTTLRFELQARSDHFFRLSSWKPSVVLPFALFWTGTLVLLLRRV